MNFFAHAVLASERNADAAFVLGAMLPDLCGFAGVRIGATCDGALGEGVRFHHASDAAFHAHLLFGAQCGELSAALERRGVRRGPARGVAHVANELLLDGWLARESGVPRAYRESLRDAPRLLLGNALAGTAEGGLSAVCARVHSSPLPEAYGDVAFVTERVERALAARPLLALEASELPTVVRALAEAQERCARWAPGVLGGVRRALAESARSAVQPRLETSTNRSPS